MVLGLIVEVSVVDLVADFQRWSVRNTVRVRRGNRKALHGGLSKGLTCCSFFPAPLRSLERLGLARRACHALSTYSQGLKRLRNVLCFIPGTSVCLAVCIHGRTLLSSRVRKARYAFSSLLDPSRARLRRGSITSIIGCIHTISHNMRLLGGVPLYAELLERIRTILLSKIHKARGGPNRLHSSRG